MNSNLVRERLVLIRTARAVRSVVLWNESAIVSELASADHFPLSFPNFHWPSGPLRGADELVPVVYGVMEHL